VMKVHSHRPDVFSTNQSLLGQIDRDGWSEHLATEFESQYGDDVRRLVALHIYRLGLTGYRFDPGNAHRILRGRCLELFENCVSDTWIALTGNLIHDYLGECKSSGNQLPFLQYLTGVIRNITIDNARNLGLLPRYSERSLLRQLCRAKREETRKAHVARALFYLQSKVQREFLSSCPRDVAATVYRDIYRLVHHFFEQYLPRQCSQIQRVAARSTLVMLARSYMQAEYKQGVSYVASLTPWDPASSTQLLDRGDPDQTSTDEEFLDILALHTSQVMA